MRWLTRYCSESPNVDLVEALAVLSALAALREDRPSALVSLAAVSRERGRTDVARAAEAALALRRPHAGSAS